MPSLTPEQLDLLRSAFALAQDPTQQEQATQLYQQLRDRLISDTSGLELLEALWNEILAARRSAAFWQQISDVEKGMSDQLAANHVQLQQNYLRLMHEQ